MLVRQEEATNQQDKCTEHMLLQSQQAWTSMPASHACIAHAADRAQQSHVAIYEVDIGCSQSSPCHARRCPHS